MSNIPPPPPLLIVTTKQESRVNSLEDYEDNNVSLHDLNIFVKKSITKLRPVAQTGPNCGLAALSMVATLTTSLCTIEDIFNEAKTRKFTNNGEMFSAINMKTLAEVFLSPWFTFTMFSDGLAKNKSLIIDRLYNGELMLIPYDADKNHSPCCKNGHKAHWALICGIMEAEDGEVCVAARHGKSRYLAVWSLDSLQRSNDNLTELDPDKANDNKAYLIPQGGVSVGLASKFILLKRNNDLL